METADIKGRSRRQKPKSQSRKDKRVSHFQTVRRGGFEESQVICRLWDIVKALEAGRKEIEKSPDPVIKEISKGQSLGNLGADLEIVGRKDKIELNMTSGQMAGIKKLADLEKYLRRQIRVEMRRYFLRRKRRNARWFLTVVLIILCGVGLFEGVIGVDRVSGNSMYPYLNHGDWIVYSRLQKEHYRDEVVVFEKNGESLVKRITGLPGDKVEISQSGGRVVVNGVQVREDYVTLAAPASGDKGVQNTDKTGTQLTVLDEQYLVLGDNRNISIDSRDSGMGTVPEEDILGRVILIVRWN